MSGFPQLTAVEVEQHWQASTEGFCVDYLGLMFKRLSSRSRVLSSRCIAEVIRALIARRRGSSGTNSGLQSGDRGRDIVSTLALIRLLTGCWYDFSLYQEFQSYQLNTGMCPIFQHQLRNLQLPCFRKLNLADGQYRKENQLSTAELKIMKMLNSLSCIIAVVSSSILQAQPRCNYSTWIVPLGKCWFVFISTFR